MKRTTDAVLTISRNVSNAATDTISLKITDQRSRVVLADMRLTLEQFAQAITGLCIDDATVDTWVDDTRIGVSQVTEVCWAHCPMPSSTSRDELLAWMRQNIHADEGQQITFSLSSRGSIRPRQPGTCDLAYTVRTWPVAAPSENEQQAALDPGAA